MRQGGGGRQPAFSPADPDFVRRVRSSFARQAVMRLLGASLAQVGPGRVAIELPYREDLTQQHGYFHAGVTSTIADSAGGYAAYTLFPAGSSVLTVEYKISLLAPADGERLLATGWVRKHGRTLTVCEFEVVAFKRGGPTTCALGVQTLMCLKDRPDSRPQAARARRRS